MFNSFYTFCELFFILQNRNTSLCRELSAFPGDIFPFELFQPNYLLKYFSN